MLKKNVKFILTRHPEAHPLSLCHPEAHPLSRHPEERSDVRVSGQVDTVVVSQGPHGGKAPSGRRASGEQGRSMVEMLGTLAIMGVLSVGAVAGYRYAITKYQANETINELKRRVVIHSQQAMVGATLDQTEMGEYTTLGYPIDVYDTGKGSFELFLQDMDKELCDALVKANWTLPIQTRVNDLLGGSCRDEGNTIAFQFQTTMSGCTSDDECLCGTCVNGKCESSCPTGEVCAKAFETGVYGCHPADKLVDNTHCDYPNPNGDGTCCDENGENCCPPDKPILTYLGGCRSCDDMEAPGYYNNLVSGGPATNPTGICQRCPNRVLAGEYCLKPCTGANEFMDRYGNCLKCSDVTSVLAEKDYGAGDCPQRIYDPGYRYSTHCEYEADEVFTLDKNSCLNCKGKRYYVYPQCKKCPADTSALTPEQQAQCTTPPTG